MRARSYLREGDQARDRGAWAEAAANYRLYLRAMPLRFDIWIQLGHALKESGRHAEALAAYSRALSGRPFDSDLLLNLGHLSKVMNLQQEAISYYQQSFEIDQNPAALAELTHALPDFTPERKVPGKPGSRVKISAVSQIMDKLIRFGSPSGSHLKMANAARDRLDWPTAAAEYKNYLAHKPGDFGIWVQLGHALKEAGRPKEALEAYERAQALNDRDADLLINLGHMFKNTGDFQRAAEWFALSAKEGHPHASIELSRLPGQPAENLGLESEAGKPLAPLIREPAGVADHHQESQSETLFIEHVATDPERTEREDVLGIGASILDPSLLQNAQPLIDRGGLPRIMIDAAAEINNLALVDPFLFTASQPCESWCLFPGRLKPWMRADMLFAEIPVEEYGLYFSSVDFVILSGNDMGLIYRLYAYISCGVIPIFVNRPRNISYLRSIVDDNDRFVLDLELESAESIISERSEWLRFSISARNVAPVLRNYINTTVDSFA